MRKRNLLDSLFGFMQNVKVYQKFPKSYYIAMWIFSFIPHHCWLWMYLCINNSSLLQGNASLLSYSLPTIRIQLVGNYKSLLEHFCHATFEIAACNFADLCWECADCLGQFYPSPLKRHIPRKSNHSLSIAETMLPHLLLFQSLARLRQTE